MHAWNWSDICKLKQEGGRGIIRIGDINSAAGIRLFWRVNTYHSFWARWMKERYLKNNSWNTATVSILDSGSRKFLMESREKALQSMHTDTQGSWEWNSGPFTFKSCRNLCRTKYSDWSYYFYLGLRTIALKCLCVWLEHCKKNFLQVSF